MTIIFWRFIHLKDAKTKQELTLSDDGAIVSEKLAELYGVKAGDKFTLTDQTVIDVLSKFLKLLR